MALAVAASAQLSALVASVAKTLVFEWLAWLAELTALVLSAQRPELKVTVLLHADEKDAAKFDAFGRPLVEQWTGKNQPALTRLDTTDIIRDNRIIIVYRLP